MEHILRNPTTNDYLFIAGFLPLKRNFNQLRCYSFLLNIPKNTNSFPSGHRGRKISLNGEGQGKTHEMSYSD